MKLLLVVWSANRSGGAEVYSEMLAIGLAGRGHDVTLLCYDASPKVAAVARVVRVPRVEWSSTPFLWRVAPELTRMHWSKHIRSLCDCSPDVIVFSPGICFSGLTKRFPAVPMIYLPHARIAPLEVRSALPPGISSRIAQFVHYRSEKQSIRGATTTIRFTTSLGELMRDYYKLPQSVSFTVIPQAIEVPKRPPEQRRGPCRVLAAGRLVASKNVSLIVESLHSVPKTGWHVSIVGDGPQRASLEASAKSLGLQDCVTFHGHADALGQYFETADVLAFPSKLENVSLVVLEAMAHGAPALVLRSDGKRYVNVHEELLSDGVDSFVAEDEADFLRRLRSLLLDPAPARALSNSAYATACQHAWPLALDRWEDLLQRTMRTSTAKQAHVVTRRPV